MERKFNSMTEEGKALVMGSLQPLMVRVERKRESLTYVKEHISDKEGDFRMERWQELSSP